MKYKKVNLLTLGEVDVPVPPKKDLENRIDAVETQDLLIRIYDGRNEYTPRQVDNAKKDVEMLYEMGLCTEDCLYSVAIRRVPFLGNKCARNIREWLRWQKEQELQRIENWSKIWVSIMADLGLSKIVQISEETALTAIAVVEDTLGIGLDPQIIRDSLPEESEENMLLHLLRLNAPPTRHPSADEREGIVIAFRVVIQEEKKKAQKRAKKCAEVIDDLAQLNIV